MGAQLFDAESEAKIDDLIGRLRTHPRDRNPIPYVDYSSPINDLPLLLMQLTRFRCGVVSIGMAISKNIVDGQSTIHFINSWAKIARGEKLVNPPPVLDRTVLQARDNPGSPRFKHVD
uniref:Uncharacterized protein n=1 Tax=Nelumbo nucifera TaxID=4432 RepID=A0A822XEQ4_NELNU|nr:TPA_asm: hypothetical protein HUJ06_019835 [Nelumbo nucifera]